MPGPGHTRPGSAGSPSTQEPVGSGDQNGPPPDYNGDNGNGGYNNNGPPPPPYNGNSGGSGSNGSNGGYTDSSPDYDNGPPSGYDGSMPPPCLR